MKRKGIGSNGDAVPSGKAPVASCGSSCSGQAVHPALLFAANFLAFPLNIIFVSFVIYGYMLLYAGSPWMRVLAIVYGAYIAYDQQVLKRCDGIGFDGLPDKAGWLAGPRLRRAHAFVRDNLLYSLSCAYYPIRMHKTCEFNHGGGERFMFVCHPHGIFGVGTMAAFGSDSIGFSSLFPGLKVHLVGLRPIFWVPFFREWCILGGAFSASRSSFERVLDDRQASVVLNLGGAAESMLTSESSSAPAPATDAGKGKGAGGGSSSTGGGQGKGSAPVDADAPEESTMFLIINDRKGFVKIALEQRCALVPCLTFEENLVFKVTQLPPSSAGRRAQMWLQRKLKIAFPLFWGHKWWPLLPQARPLNMYIGSPIPCEEFAAGGCLDPGSLDERGGDGLTGRERRQRIIDGKHAEYCSALEALFHEYKHHAGFPKWQVKLIGKPSS